MKKFDKTIFYEFKITNQFSGNNTISLLGIDKKNKDVVIEIINRDIIYESFVRVPEKLKFIAIELVVSGKSSETFKSLPISIISLNHPSVITTPIELKNNKWQTCNIAKMDTIQFDLSQNNPEITIKLFPELPPIGD